MHWQKMFNPISSFKTAGRLLAPYSKSSYDCLFKVDTKHGRRSPLPYSPFYTIHRARFVLSSIGELGGMVIAGQLFGLGAPPSTVLEEVSEQPSGMAVE